MFFGLAKNYGHYIHRIFGDCNGGHGLAVCKSLGESEKLGL